MALQPLDHFGILLACLSSSISNNYAALMSADSVCSGLNLHSANLPVNLIPKKKVSKIPQILTYYAGLFSDSRAHLLFSKRC